jgi:hypothetical protein
MLAQRARTSLLALGASAALIVSSLVWLATVPLQTASAGWLEVVVLGWCGCAVLLRLLTRAERPPLIQFPAPILITFVALFSLFVDIARIQRYQAIAYATGQISRTAYLMTQSPEFPAEHWVNEHTPTDAYVALVNISTGYYLDRDYVDDWYGTTFSLLETSARSRQAVLRQWCAVGVRYVVFNHGGALFGDLTPHTGLSAYTWLAEPGLHARPVFSLHSIDVIAVQPCAARPGAGND